MFTNAVEISGRTRDLRSLVTLPAGCLDRLLSLGEVQLSDEDQQKLATTPRVFPERVSLVELSQHERALLDLLAKGHSRQQIADDLYLSLNTVKTHMRNLYQKVRADTREGAILNAVELALLDP